MPSTQTETGIPTNNTLRIAAILGIALFWVAALWLPLTVMYIASALLGSLVLFLYTRPIVRDRLAIVVLAALFLLSYHWFWHLTEKPRFLEYWSALGIGTWIVLGIRIAWSNSADVSNELIRNVLIPSALMLALLYASQNFVNTMGMLHPKTLDLYAFSFDGSLGFQPSFLVGRLFARYWWFRWIGAGVYYSILFVMCVAFAARLRHGTNRMFMLEIFFVAAFLGYIAYNIFPVAGPGYAFGSAFPNFELPFSQARRLLVEPIPLYWGVERNGMPSLHMTWALQIWWNMREVSKLAYRSAFVYAMITFLGTMGVAEHYMVDLIVAFPFALMVQAICTRSLPWRSGPRQYCFAGGLAGVTVWLILLRFANPFFWISPLIPWTLVILSVAASLYGLNRLQSASPA